MNYNLKQSIVLSVQWENFLYVENAAVHIFSL